MNVELVKPHINQQLLIKNMFVFYRYDLLPFQSDDSGINEYGIIDEQDSKTHTDGVKDCDIWWTDSAHFPFLIKLNDKPVGFIMVQSAKQLPHVPVDYGLIEFFILNQYRKLGIGARAVSLLFKELPGKWELGWLENNTVAENFWRRTISSMTDSVQDFKLYKDKDSDGNDRYAPGLRFEIM